MHVVLYFVRFMFISYPSFFPAMHFVIIFITCRFFGFLRRSALYLSFCLFVSLARCYLGWVLYMLIFTLLMLLLPSELCRCLLICVACCSCHRGFEMLISLFCMLPLPSGLCGCSLICLHAALAIGVFLMFFQNIFLVFYFSNLSNA